MTAAGPRYLVTLRTLDALRYVSHVLTGLFELQRQGTVLLHHERDHRLHGFGHFCVSLRVEDRHTGRAHEVALDLKDAPDVLMRAAWERHDVVYKRSLVPAYAARLTPPEHAHKLRPYGLYLDVRGDADPDLRPLLGFSLRASLEHLDRRAIWPPTPGRLWPQLLSRWRERPAQALAEHARYWRLAELERAPTPTTEPLVVFQTRLFDTGRHLADPPAFRDSKHALNAARIATLRRLRSELGPRFSGGLVPDAFARREAPDALATEHTDRPAYLRLLDRARVVVYGHGLVGSVGGKLAEYLARGRAVVAERLPVALPYPLEGVTEVDDADALVAACLALLDAPDEAHALGRAAFATWRAHVRPDAHALRLLASP